MPTLSPEILEFLKFFLANNQRFDSAQQSVNVQSAPGLSGGEQQSMDAFQSFFKGLNDPNNPEPTFSKFSFFS